MTQWTRMSGQRSEMSSFTAADAAKKRRELWQKPTMKRTITKSSARCPTKRPQRHRTRNWSGLRGILGISTKKGADWPSIGAFTQKKKIARATARQLWAHTDY